MKERRAPLDRRQVAAAGLKLLNEAGLHGLTLRAIAKELDVKAPALYWHFKDKQALLDEMAVPVAAVAASPCLPLGHGPLIEAEGRHDRLEWAAMAEQGKHQGYDVHGRP